MIVTSPLTAKILAGDFGVPRERITVAEPGTARKARATGSKSDIVNMLAVGSIVPRKGYGVLVEALHGLKRRNWKLRIAGTARSLETVNALRDQIRLSGLDEHIQLLGAVPDRDLDNLFETADLFVMSSLFEGYGMVLGEALQRGLPIVTTTGGAASETVPDGAGLKVPPGDVAALRKALDDALADPGLRERLAEAAHRAGQNLPTWEDTARIIAGALKALPATNPTCFICLERLLTMGFSADWLALREPADHRSRSAELLATLATRVEGRDTLRITDLGCGTGSNLRATAPALGPTRNGRWWITTRPCCRPQRRFSRNGRMRPRPSATTSCW